jgi:hypothetical protein
MKTRIVLGFALVAFVFGGSVGCPEGINLQTPTGEPGPAGPPGQGYVALEPEGVVGFVRDTAGDPVSGATVYLVPGTDIPTAPISVTDLAAARESADDEPLEDTIAAKGTGYAQAITDATGQYRITTVPAGAYFIVAVPADADHLPGGSLCRTSRSASEIAGQQLDIELSTTPSPAAECVGPSVCLNCHGMVHAKQTLHMLGLRKVGEVGPLQNGSRFPAWNVPLDKFTPEGTTLYYYGYNGKADSPDWKLSETDPGSGVSFTARMYTSDGKYYVELADVKGASGAATYEVEMTYGGGLYKQRFMTNIAGSRYILPIGYNTEGQPDETQPYSRWVWQQYNAQNWYDEAVPALKRPALKKAFDNNCAGCHFTGFALTGDATSGFRAHAVPDVNGEMDFDGDGMAEAINISCETCHGPGSEHWQNAGRGRAIVSPRLLTPEREVTLCAQCHTRVQGVGGGVTETPLDAGNRMLRAGARYQEFLSNHASEFDHALWDATKGDGKHSRKHHWQAFDFIQSKKYRNASMLMTCSDCHDVHGNNGLEHQLLDQPDRAKSGAGLCMSCHAESFPTGATIADREAAHYASKGIPNIGMLDTGCTDCHMPKTAKSGAGFRQNTIENVTYYSGDIASHLFDVPRRTSVATKTSDMMPIPYTNAYGLCHFESP